MTKKSLSALESEAESPRFEVLLKELETIASDLDGGQLPLGEAMAAFERGMKLCKQGEEILAHAERIVETYREMTTSET